ncbi:MAG: hypothetical protein QOF63_1419, partial [Thermoanaerobaculia bacterium]|nr:hypothetical protein [Thermoanaerobaculia bacterium]
MSDDCAPAGQGEYVVQQGDSIVSIACAAGLLPETVWSDAANAALKELRKNGELLLPGDRLTVSPIRPKLLDRATGNRHVFRRKNVPATVTLYLLDDEGAPFAGKKYEASIEEVVHSGTTGDDGKIDVPIEPGSREGELKVWLEEPGLPSPWICDLRLGELYPIEHTLGVQQRLSNLGLYVGDLDGEPGPATKAAVTAFQTEQKLTANGEIDQATRDKLDEVHKV